MSVFCYDNPHTMSRECWQDGKLLYTYTAFFLLHADREPEIQKHLFFGANIGKWKTGQFVGDMRAMYPYVWRWRKFPALAWGAATGTRHGMRCRVVARGRTMNTALVEFEDGAVFVTSRNGLRKA